MAKLKATSVEIGTNTTTTRQQLSAVNGELTYDTTQNILYMYTPVGWVQVAGKDPVVSGGSVTTSGGQTIHTFTTSGTFSIQGGAGITVSYLVVGGGGGGPGVAGGQAGKGGGGAGGIVYRTGLTLNPGSYSATVGGGGSSGVADNYGVASAGTDSYFGPNIAEGGGYGSDPNNSGLGGAGASSGGSAYPAPTVTTCNGTPNPGASGQTTPAPSIGFGHPGGQRGHHGSGGGGGAGSVGQSAAQGGGPEFGGDGGNGLSYSISGTATLYGGGGGGGAGNYSQPRGDGGPGGGGQGGSQPQGRNATDGQANTGGGGGGAGGSHNISPATGGAGGSGIVIVSYPTP